MNHRKGVSWHLDSFDECLLKHRQQWRPSPKKIFEQKKFSFLPVTGFAEHSEMRKTGKTRRRSRRWRCIIAAKFIFFRCCRKTNFESTSDQLVLRWDISHFPLQVISGKKSIFFVSESESFSKIFVTESIFVRKFRFPSCWVIPSGDLTRKRHLQKRKRKKLCYPLHRNNCFIWTKVKFGLMVRCVVLFFNDLC